MSCPKTSLGFGVRVRRCGGLLLVGAVGLLAVSAGLPAMAAAIVTSGNGSMAQGNAKCAEQAMAEARVKALTDEIAELAGRFDRARHADLLRRAEAFVQAEQQRSFEVANSRFCEVVARFRFKTPTLKEALKRTAAGGARVGAVLRYVVNGELAEDRGINPLEAVNTLNRELGKYNCRLVDLLFEQDLFAQRIREHEVPLTGDEDDPGKVYETGLSHAEAVRNALVGAAQELERALGLGREGFDRVVSGEVSIRQLGKDPDSPNQVAGALISLSMHEVSTGNIVVTTRPIPLRAPGVDALEARNLVLASAIESAVGSLAEETAICGR